MADSKKPTPADTHVPPPLDPFPTYQTPYQRQTSDNENPFISFRRFADEQLNHLLSGLPRILGAPTSSPSQSEIVSKSFEERSLEQATRLEAELHEMIRRRHEEAEGFRKQIEQEREERRMENEKRNEDENARWAMMQRGIEKCPALKSKMTEPATELDLYDRMEEQKDDADSKRRNRQWKNEGRRGWLSGLGWDGRGKTQNTRNQDPSRSASQQDPTPLDLSPEEHLQDLDPFKHDNDLHAYLVESKYSPIRLMLPNCFSARYTDSFHQEADNASDAPPVSDLDRKMADHLRWSEAFNDLLSLEKTGNLPPRDHASLFSMAPFRAFANGPFGDPFSREMKRLIEKSPRREHEDSGLHDGDFWDGDIDISPLGTGIMALLMGAALSGIPVRAISNNQDISRREIEQKQPEETEPKHNDLGAHGMFWPGPEAVLSLIDRVRQLDMEANSQDEPIEEKIRCDPQDHDNIASSSSSSTSMSSWSMSNPASNDGPTSIISTLTNTQTRTLADGTTETKRVLKRRFADGREECDESVEVRPGNGENKKSIAGMITPPTSKVDHASTPSTNQIQKMIESKSTGKDAKKQTNESSKEKSGWFWN